MPRPARSRKAPVPTVIEIDDEGVWAPLEAVARIARASPDLPSFHPAEFMYMATARDPATGVRIHLYKHIDTRRYLNLDDAGHAHAYYGSGGTDDGDTISGGLYGAHASLKAALDHVEFSAFETEGLYRSFPPEEWPEDPTDEPGCV